MAHGVPSRHSDALGPRDREPCTITDECGSRQDGELDLGCSPARSKVVRPACSASPALAVVPLTRAPQHSARVRVPTPRNAAITSASSRLRTFVVSDVSRSPELSPNAPNRCRKKRDDARAPMTQADQPLRSATNAVRKQAHTRRPLRRTAQCGTAKGARNSRRPDVRAPLVRTVAHAQAHSVGFGCVVLVSALWRAPSVEGTSSGRGERDGLRSAQVEWRHIAVIPSYTRDMRPTLREE